MQKLLDPVTGLLQAVTTVKSLHSSRSVLQIHRHMPQPVISSKMIISQFRLAWFFGELVT